METEFESEQELEAGLIELLETTSGLDEDEAGVEGFSDCRTSSFESEGVMTMNRGVVLRMANGAEFQITIVRSR